MKVDEGQLKEILDQLENVNQTSENQWMALCPAHSDHNPSLSIKYEDGKILLHCFAGCKYKEILESLKFDKGSIYLTKRESINHKPKIESKVSEISDEVKKKIDYILKTSREATDDHPYLVAKGVKSYDLKLYKDFLLVMLVLDLDGKIHSLQFISDKGEKNNLSGGKKKGNFFFIDGDTRKSIVCEGYATGASIREATGYCIYIALDAGNIGPVVEGLKSKCPEQEIIICADNDASNTKKGTLYNPGVEKATEVAWRYGTKVAIPAFNDTSTKPTDFNDLHQKEGLEEVKRQIDLARSPEDELVDIFKNDPSTPFSSEIIQKIGNLKSNDKNRFLRLKERLNGAGVPITKLDKALISYEKSPSVGSRNDKSKERNPEQSEAAEILAINMKDYFAFNKKPEKWLKYIEGYWQSCLHQEFREIISKKLKNNLNFPNPYQIYYFNGVIELLKNELPFEQNHYTKNLLPFKNGILDLKSRQLIPNDPAYGFTWQLPYEYNPQADCKPIKQWIAGMVGNNDELVKLLRAYLYAIVRGMVYVHRFLELVGPGGAGKSVFLWLAMQIVGEANTLTTELKYLENNRFETANLYNKRLALITDAERYTGDISTLKALTGGDPLRFEEKYKQNQNQFYPEAMVLIACNEAIQSGDYTSGLKRRRITVYIKNPVPLEQQRDLRKDFEPYVPGLLNWVLDMNEDEVSRILKTQGSKIQRQYEKQNLLDTNPMAAWLDKNVVYKDSARSYVGTANKIKDQDEILIFKNEDTWLYPNYVKFSHLHGTKPISQRRFSGLLEDLCRHQLQIKDITLNPKDSRGRSFSGLEIRNIRNSHFQSPVEFYYDNENVDTEICRSVMSDDLPDMDQTTVVDGNDGSDASINFYKVKSKNIHDDDKFSDSRIQIPDLSQDDHMSNYPINCINCDHYIMDMPSGRCKFKNKQIEDPELERTCKNFKKSKCSIECGYFENQICTFRDCNNKIIPDSPCDHPMEAFL